jgi:hypothetical protein
MEGVSGRFVGPAHPDRLRHNVLATGCAAYIYRTAHNNSAWRLQYTCVAVNKRAWVRTKQHKGEGKQAAGPTMRVWCGRGEKREGWADRRWRLWQPPSIILRDTVRKGACPLGCAPLQGSEQGRGGLWVVQAHTQICPGGPEAEVPPLLHRKLHGSMGRGLGCAKPLENQGPATATLGTPHNTNTHLVLYLLGHLGAPIAPGQRHRVVAVGVHSGEVGTGEGEQETGLQPTRRKGGTPRGCSTR